VRLFLSGPAAGVIGASMAGAAAGHEDVITMDIGGTSADIALVSGGRPLIAAEGRLDGYAVRVPMVDVNAIGAGGGSVAWLDRAGSLRVGPGSAGSEPGPACYGRGGAEPTVTDASVVLGYIDPGYFAGGTLALDAALAWRAIEQKIARALGLSVEEAALGIHRVVNANMAEGVRFVSVKRGVDPRGYALVPLGGAGPVHAAALARELGMRRVVVPRYPGVLSAAGLLAAPIEHEAAGAFHHALERVTRDDLALELSRLDRQCAELMRSEGVAAGAVTVLHYADACYVGQSHHLEVPVTMDGDPVARIRDEFYAAHERIYGHAAPGAVQLVNLRAVHQAPAAGNRVAPAPAARGDALKGVRRILTERSGGFVEARVYERAHMTPGAAVSGPAIVEQPDTTTVVEPGWRAAVDERGNLIMTGEAE
jgi:N-methylhydantoinase A/oxoprolinase/acetone carboxylase beta subunit